MYDPKTGGDVLCVLEGVPESDLPEGIHKTVPASLMDWHASASVDLRGNLSRWYDPTVGVWLSEDPIGFEAGDANLGRYVENAPIGAVDPSGLKTDPKGLTNQQARQLVRTYLSRATALDPNAKHVALISKHFVTTQIKHLVGKGKSKSEDEGWQFYVRGDTYYPQGADLAQAAESATSGAVPATGLRVISSRRDIEKLTKGMSVAVLELSGHAQHRHGISIGTMSTWNEPQRTQLIPHEEQYTVQRGMFTEVRTRKWFEMADRWSEQYIDRQNAREFGQWLTRHIRFTNNALIVLESCNIGAYIRMDTDLQGRDGKSVVQIIADETGIPVLSPGGYVFGSFHTGRSLSVVTDNRTAEGRDYHRLLEDDIAKYSRIAHFSTSLEDVRNAEQEVKRLEENRHLSYNSKDLWYLTTPDRP